MIDCSKCIHTEVCANKPVNDGAEGTCSFYINTQLAPKSRPVSEVTKEYAEGYAAGFNMAARPLAYWIYNQYDGNPNIGNYHCSNCHWIKPTNIFMSYCGSCGAKMNWRKTNETNT